MSDSLSHPDDGSLPPLTEITLTGSERLRVSGEPRTVEAAILAAARGSIMELAWLVEADTGQPVGVNPDHVLMLREAAPAPAPEPSLSPGAARAADRG